MTKNLTSGPPTRLIVLFALPLLVGNIFQQLYQFTDAVVVGRLISVDALASVGATGAVIFLLIGLSWGSSTGLAIPVARAYGAGDRQALGRTVAAGTAISAGLAVFITVVGVVTARPLLELLETPPELVDDAVAYLEVTFWGASAMVAFNYLSAIIRALGDSRTPLVFLVLSCLINAVLVVALVGGLGMGVAGAALATVVAQVLSVAACLELVRRRMPELAPRGEDWRLRWSDLDEPVRVGLSMGLQMSVIAVGAVVLQYAVNSLGASAVAAFTAAARVDMLAVTPLNSLGLALATYVAQNRGAGSWRRVRAGVLRTTWLALGCAVALGGVVITAGVPLVRLFVGDDDAVVAMARQYLVVSGVLYGFLALLFVYRNAVQGLGRAGSPTVSGFAELVLRAVAGIVLVRELGFLGVCLAAPLAWVGGLVPVAVAWFRERARMAGPVAPVARAVPVGVQVDDAAETPLPPVRRRRTSRAGRTSRPAKTPRGHVRPGRSPVRDGLHGGAVPVRRGTAPAPAGHRVARPGAPRRRSLRVGSRRTRR
ncbi:MATE family efflux transporter [Isoptericola halotolerans]|uniref:MATE family efflux protein n=1 Tax=Isoptericola halotolerans TaxID=300560 RepID=A0ABX2A5Q0_9MICO|nr:MATE family efflux transporter [Isoptericola halotolerans]NOV98040.1 putative MATE family efflux protein [Isoptericola halotolerans]